MRHKYFYREKGSKKRRFSSKNILNKKYKEKICPNCGDNNVINIHSSFYSCPNCNYLFDSINEKFDGIPNILLDK